MVSQVSEPRENGLKNDERETQWNSIRVEDLDSISAVEAAYKATIKAQEEVDSKLESLTQKSATTNRTRAATLSAMGQQTMVVEDDSAELVSLLEAVGRKGDGVAKQVRHFDKMLRNGRELLARVDGILQLRRCAEGSKDALQKGDLKRAAGFVDTYLELDAGVNDDESSLPARAVIEGVSKELTSKIRNNAEAARDKEGMSISEMLSIVHLFVPLGLREEGLDRFATWLKTRIAVESEQDIRSLLMEGDKAGSGVDEPHIIALTRLYETIAGNLHEGESEVRTMFGDIAFTKLAVELQSQCDVQAQKILTRYIEEKGIDQLMRATRTGTANAQDLGSLLGELVLISQRTIAFCSFITQRCSSEDPTNENIGSTDEAKKTSETPAKEAYSWGEIDVSLVVASSELTKWNDELASKYVTLESYVMEKNSSKAISIDEWQSPSSLTSTAVDDIFFILQKSIQRAQAYGTNAEIIIALLRRVNFCLKNMLLPHVRARLREAQGAAFGSSTLTTSNLDPNKILSSVSYIAEFAKVNIPLSSEDTASSNEQAGGAPTASKYDMYVALNNASLSGNYASRLHTDIERILSEKYSSSRDQVGIAECLAQIHETSRLLKQVVDGGLARLVDTLIGPLQNGLDRMVSQMSYVVDESGYDELGFGSFVTAELEKGVLRREMEERLAEENWDSVVRKTAESVSEMIESGVFLGRGNVRFNALGGLKADREVRQLTGWFAGKSKRAAVRDVFARLTQCAMVVGLEKLSEIHDIWDRASGVSWRLTAVEVKKVMSKRVDFRQESVRTLRL